MLREHYKTVMYHIFGNVAPTKKQTQSTNSLVSSLRWENVRLR